MEAAVASSRVDPKLSSLKVNQEECGNRPHLDHHYSQTHYLAQHRTNGLKESGSSMEEAQVLSIANAFKVQVATIGEESKELQVMEVQ